MTRKHFDPAKMVESNISILQGLLFVYAISQTPVTPLVSECSEV